MIVNNAASGSGSSTGAEDPPGTLLLVVWLVVESLRRCNEEVTDCGGDTGLLELGDIARPSSTDPFVRVVDRGRDVAAEADLELRILYTYG